MYWNLMSKINSLFVARLIVTWDVLKQRSFYIFGVIEIRLIVTWDVLKPGS